MRPVENQALPQNIFSEIHKRDTESKLEYSKRLNALLHKHMLKFYVDELSLKKFNLRVPASENWILYLLPVLKSDYSIYEFISYKKALIRGSGLCSQFAMTYVSILNKNNINAKILPLGNHVVASYLDNQNRTGSFVADPYLGAFIPFDLEDIQATPEKIRFFYERKASEDYITMTIDSFKKQNYMPLSMIEYVGWKSYYFEPISYILKWLIPVLLMMPLILIKIKEGFAHRSSSKSIYLQGGNGEKEG